MKKPSFTTMLKWRRRLAAGSDPASLLDEATPYGFDLDALKALQASVRRDGAATIRFGCGNIEIKTR